MNKSINDYLSEGVQAKRTIKLRQEALTEIIEECSEALGIEKPVVTSMINKAYDKSENFEKYSKERDKSDEVYATLDGVPKGVL